MNQCEFFYKCGPKKNQQCTRRCRNDMCFQHANQVKKEQTPVTTKPEVVQNKYIQLKNTKSTNK